MILEQAKLQVREGQDDAFRTAIAKARPLVSGAPGFQGIEVRPAAETPGLYLLLVRWDSIAAHRDGLRQSAAYQEWRTLLHGFYAPMPVVTYFEEPLAL